MKFPWEKRKFYPPKSCERSFFLLNSRNDSEKDIMGLVE